MTKRIETKTDMTSTVIKTTYKYADTLLSTHNIDNKLKVNSFIDLLNKTTKDGGDYTITFKIGNLKIELSQYVFLSRVEVKINIKNNKFIQEFKQLQNSEELSSMLFQQIFKTKYNLDEDNLDRDIEIVKALIRFKTLNGKNWKNILSNIWRNGDYSKFAESADIPFLQRARNLDFNLKAI